MFQKGQQIGLYTLVEKLGKGGFGEVWLAEKRSQFVTKRVAVKLPLDEQVNFDAIRQEATLWEQASGHANVLPIIDADVYDGQVVIVSEYADGGSLADKLKAEGKLSIREAVETTVGILSGLQYLHGKHIIHRDIKPQNILLQGETPRLADFGISRAMQTTAVSSTIIGTDAYMSPEAFDGKRSVQTDIWSVGVVLYQLLAGSLPFPQEHPSERMFAIFSKEFAPLGDEIPLELKKIVDKALAKQPENRYQTTAEMRGDLQKALVGIAHPTFAKTEVLRIPAAQETLPELAAVENKYQTVEPEKETVVSNPPVNLPAVTQPAVQQESVVTQFKQTPFMENKPLPTEAQKFADATHSTGLESKLSKYVIGGFIGLSLLIFLIAIVIDNIINRPNISQSTYTPNTSNQPRNAAIITNGNSNSASNSGSPTKLDIELSVTSAEIIFFRSVIDGKIEYFDMTSGSVKNFIPQQSLELRYYKGLADKVQLKINDKMITLPKADQVNGNNIEFEITKDNLNQVLQSGKISP